MSEIRDEHGGVQHARVETPHRCSALRVLVLKRRQHLVFRRLSDDRVARQTRLHGDLVVVEVPHRDRETDPLRREHLKAIVER